MTLSVLIVDDDRAVRDMLTDFLSTLGHSTQSVESADAGRTTLGESTPDIVLIDLRLPGGEGLALLESLRAQGPQVGAIMLAGRSDAPAAILAMRNGALDYLEKPIRLDSLEASLLRSWELLRARRENAVLRTLAQPDDAGASAVRTMASAERRAIRDALKSTGGNKLRAAKLLGIARSTLLEKLKRIDAVM